jgi:hypothetical protein
MTPVDPDIDAYGSKARASALADFLELMAIDGVTLTRAALADLIADRSWTRKMHDMINPPELPLEEDVGEDLDEDDDGSAEDDPPGMPAALRVFDVLAEREELLGAAYPFDVTDHVVTLRAEATVEESLYIALLAMTVAHAYSVNTTYDPKRVFEATVDRALATMVPLTVNVGELSRQVRDFDETVRQAGRSVGLRPTPQAGFRLVHGNEQGLDVLGHCPVGDVRPGLWVFIGQVTCGSSDTWMGKIKEPSETGWRILLNTGCSPIAFLAVPHHAEADHLSHLVQDSDRVVLDRLRIASTGLDLDEEEVTIIREVRDAGVEQLA